MPPSDWAMARARKFAGEILPTEVRIRSDLPRTLMIAAALDQVHVDTVAACAAEADLIAGTDVADAIRAKFAKPEVK